MRSLILILGVFVVGGALMWSQRDRIGVVVDGKSSPTPRPAVLYCDGFGSDGKPKRCLVDSSREPCTPIFNLDDRLNVECTAQGGTSCRCGCHDFVCSKVVTFR